MTQLNDLLAKMLKYDKNERISAQKALKHVFIIIKQSAADKSVLDDLILNRIISFLKRNNFLKLLAFQYSSRWRDSYCQPLKEALGQIDSDNDGIISYKEFMTGSRTSRSL